MTLLPDHSFSDYFKNPLNIEKIKAQLPLELGVLLTRYVDPFVGNGEVFFEIMEHYGMDDAVICDTNPELINLYNQIKRNPEAIIEMLQDWEKQFNAGSWEERHSLYKAYTARYGYMKGNDSADMATKRAAIFLFLSEASKIFRNEPVSGNIISPGYQPMPAEICKTEYILKASHCLKSTKIICGDFKECLPYVNNQTFLFINPPKANSNQAFSTKDIKAVECFSKIASYIGAEVFITSLPQKIADKNKRSDYKE